MQDKMALLRKTAPVQESDITESALRGHRSAKTLVGQDLSVC